MFVYFNMIVIMKHNNMDKVIKEILGVEQNTGVPQPAVYFIKKYRKI